MTAEEIKTLIRDIPDFPKPGIMFRDITPLIGNARGFAAVVDQMAEPYLGAVDVVLGIESRGFIVGAPLAYRLGVGLTIARKPGKLPYRFFDQTYDLEYGSASLQIHQDGIANNARVLIADDIEDNRQLLAQLLAPVGFEIRLAVNGAEAIHDFHRKRVLAHRILRGS